MAFTPKFVDLVRNTTTTVGTGPIVLGAAVDGYTGFAQACAAGDQFYYCIQGVDRPTEREVGRGTMLANGTIDREPIDGAATNFKSGTKTVALVAAAEWYDKVSGGSGSAATRAALAATSAEVGKVVRLDEAGREGLFRFDGGDQAGGVALDAGQGLYVAPDSDPSGASGAWVRVVDGSVDPGWFGVVEGGTAAADNSVAMTSLLAVLKARARNAEGFSQALEGIRFRPGHFHFAETIDLDGGTILFEGGGGAKTDGPLTKLQFADGVTGIRVQASKTTGASSVVAAKAGAGGSVIRGLQIRGGFGGTESEAHGIHLRASAAIERVTIADFAGDGLFISASAGQAEEGNANGFSIDRVRIIRCRNGLFVDGADANAGTATALDVVANRQWGVWDSSFLGNNYVGCHSAANGWDGAISSTPTACVHNGNRYYVKAGQAEGAATNAPTGTTADNQWWGYIGAGGTYWGIVAWASGTAFREGGAYRTDNANARNVLIGCYSEGDQNPAQLTSPTLLIGGLHGAGTGNYAGHLDTSLGQLNAKGAMKVSGLLTAANPVNTFGSTSGAAADSYLYIDNTANYSNLSFRSWSGGAPSNDALVKSWRGNGLVLTSKNVTNFGIDFVAGSFEIRSTHAALSMPGAKLGYTTGAGGTVTQATSKATAVTLGKACGSIVTHNAAIAAGEVASFTLTNSVIAATDTVLVTLAAGGAAGAYAVSVDAVAAGSCRISVRNLTAGALGDALTLNFAVVKAVTA